MEKKRTLNNFIYIYYAALLIYMLSWNSQNTAPPILMRTLFTFAVFTPLWFVNQWLLPAVTICFYSIASYNYAYTYLPTELYIYFFILAIGALIKNKINHLPLLNIKKILHPNVYIFTFLTLTVNLITGLKIESIVICLAIIILMQYYNNQDIKSLLSLEYCFMTISFVLSIMFLVMRTEFSQNVNYFGLERYGWTDPNYFGMVIGMGSIISFKSLFENNIKHSLPLKFIILLIVILSLFVLVVNASRGALLATSIAIIIILLLSKTKTKYKILILTLLIFLILYLLYNSYFDLLLYRLQNDDGTGSRAQIWLTKLNLFLGNNNILYILFGIGHTNAFQLGAVEAGYDSSVIGSHNDYIAVLVSYGVIGLISFFSLFISPIKKISKESKPIVYTLIGYLAICLLTLEPLTAGRLTFWGFYYYIVVYSRTYKKIEF